MVILTAWLPAFAATAYAHTLAALANAFVLGTLIGLERQWRQRSAGLRTTVLVAVGSAAFANLGMQLLGVEGATRIIGLVVSGIGFLGAGVILKDGAQIRGLNTAATLWCAAAVGTFAGTGLQGEAATVAAFVLVGNTLLRPLVNWVNRRPIVPHVTEAQYHVHAVGQRDAITHLRALLAAELRRARYPVREIKVLSGGAEQVELAAVLVPSTADPAELDGVVTSLRASPLVRSATWSVEALS